MSLRIDPAKATHADLVAEVRRLDEVCNNWSSSWQAIVKANTDAWLEQVTVLRRAVEALQKLLAHLPDDAEVPSAYVVAAHMALANLPISLRHPPIDKQVGSQ